MIKRNIVPYVLSSIFWIATSAFSSSHAAVFERDWKVTGDGLLTFDSVNQREWLDLTETDLRASGGFDVEASFQSIAAEVTPGGLYEGFTIAKSSDVLELAQSAGIDNSTIVPASINMISTLELIALLGENGTFTFPEVSGRLTVAYLDEFVGPPNFPLSRAAGALFYFPQSGGEGSSGLRFGNQFSGDIFTISAGVFLYRQTVPEPSTFIGLCSISLMSLLARHRKSRIIDQAILLER